MNIDHTKREALKDAGVKLFAVIGLVVLLSLLVFGIVQIARTAPSISFANLNVAVVNLTSRFFPVDEPKAIKFTMPSALATSGEAFIFSWENDEDAGSYIFSYECRDGFSFSVPGQIDANGIVCDQPYSFDSSSETLTLIPSSPNLRILDVPVTIARASDETISGNVLISVMNESPEENVEEEKKESPVVTPVIGTPFRDTQVIGTVTPVSDPNGKPDLIVFVLSVGKIDETTGEYIVTSSVTRKDEAAVRFQVTNIGTKNSGEWEFEADLPTSPSYTYEPRAKQTSLGPQERAEYTLSFDSIRNSDTGVVTIEIDPNKTLDEFTRTNNTAKATLTIVR